MMIRTFLLTALFALPSFAGNQDNSKVEGTTQDIKWGAHWAGPEVKAPAALKGKVVLLKIWGG